MLVDVVIKDVADVVLLSAQTYMLVRLKLTKNAFFHTPFFDFFYITGVCGALSVVGYIMDIRFVLTENTAWIFKAGFIINVFGATASTIGKFLIVLHRYVVMRNGSLIEDVWSRRVTRKLCVGLFILSSLRCIPLFWCEYAYAVIDHANIVTYFDDQCVVVDKITSSATYAAYSIGSVALTVLTSRELIRLSRSADAETKNVILQQQKNMFIVVAICTLSHVVKALHQMSWVFIAAFRLSSWNSFVKDSYAYPHYLATYTTSITLVIFSSKIRDLLLSRGDKVFDPEPKKPP